MTTEEQVEALEARLDAIARVADRNNNDRVDQEEKQAKVITSLCLGCGALAFLVVSGFGLNLWSHHDMRKRIDDLESRVNLLSVGKDVVVSHGEPKEAMIWAMTGMSPEEKKRLILQEEALSAVMEKMVGMHGNTKNLVDLMDKQVSLTSRVVSRVNWLCENAALQSSGSTIQMYPATLVLRCPEK